MIRIHYLLYTCTKSGKGEDPVEISCRNVSTFRRRRHPGFFRHPPAAVLRGKEPGAEGCEYRIRQLGELATASNLAKPMVHTVLTT